MISKPVLKYQLDMSSIVNVGYTTSANGNVEKNLAYRTTYNFTITKAAPLNSTNKYFISL